MHKGVRFCISFRVYDSLVTCECFRIELNAAHKKGEGDTGSQRALTDSRRRANVNDLKNRATSRQDFDIIVSSRPYKFLKRR